MAVAQKSQQTGYAFALLGMLVVIALIVKYYLWVLGGVAAIGTYYAGRYLWNRLQQRRESMRRQVATLTRRADQQFRWTLINDPRGTYGADGAAIMEQIGMPAALSDHSAVDSERDSLCVAHIARSSTELTEMLTARPAGWPWAAFASVLLQRQAPLMNQLNDSALGFLMPSVLGARAANSVELARALTGMLEEMSSTMRQLDRFLTAPAFTSVFGHPGAESSADAQGITHVAHRLMDFHDRFLMLSERCRAMTVSAKDVELVSECAALLDAPLQGYREFISEYARLIDALPVLLRNSPGRIELGPVELTIDTSDAVIDGVVKQIRAACYTR